MRRILLSFALVAIALGVNAQVGVKTITTSNGTTTKASSEVVQQQNTRAIISDAEVVWHHNEEYGIGGNVFISEENLNAVVNWETNDARIESYSENGMAEWTVATTAEWPFLAANKAGNLYAVVNDGVVTLLDNTGSTVATINAGGSVGAVAVNKEGTAIYLSYGTGSYENNNMVAFVARYTSDGVMEWATEAKIGSDIADISISDDNSKLIAADRGNSEIYVLDPESGDILQDGIYYYNNSAKQPPVLNADGAYLAWCDMDGKGHLCKWDGDKYVEQWNASLKMSGQSSCWGYSNAITPDGSSILFGTLGFVSDGYDGCVFLFNNYSNTPVWVATTGGPVNNLDITADGSLIAVATDGPMNHSTGDILIFRRQSAEPFLSVNTPGSMCYIDITDDGAYCAGAGKGVHSYEMGWGGNAYLIKSTPSYVGSIAASITLNQVNDFSDAMITVEGLEDYYVYTNAEGAANLKYIPEGTYSVTISKIGFNPQTINNVQIKAGEATALEATLEPVGSPIKNLYATQGSEVAVNLRWDAYEDAFEGYNIYRKDDINATYTEVLATLGTDATTYVDETAIPTKSYYYAVTASLAGNLETPLSNNAYGYASTAYITEVIEVYNGTAPTIDGILSADEWADAFKADISDFSGISEGIDPIGTVYLYLKTDGNKLYMAIVDYADTELTENDCLALYFDDNNDHVYPQDGDNSEGNYWFKYSGGTGILQYRPIYETGSTGDIVVVEDAQVAFSDAAGHVTGEFVLEFGNEDHQIKLGNEDASSVYLFYRSSGSEYHAYWPYNNIDTFNPIAYDTFKFFTNDEAPEAAKNLRVDEDILGWCNYVPVRWDMPEMNDFKHFLVHVNSPDVAYTVYGPEVVIDVESNTDYSVFVTTVDNYGHVSDPSETLTFHVGNINVNEIAATSVSLYPNPASSVVYIQTELTGEATANIVDLTGRLVKSVNISDMQNASINVEDINTGVYFFMIQQENTIIVRKVTVR